jgi:hypothetical protein
MTPAILKVAFALLCCLLIAQGALQCIAPHILKQVQDKLRPRGSWSASAGGTFFERLRERQATNPSPLYRFAGVVEIALGFLMLLGVLGFFRR